MIGAPLLVLTSDVDWASDACIEDLADAAAEFDIPVVFHATGESPALRRLHREGRAEIGLHPNFRHGSDHGNCEDTVLDHIRSLWPEATTFRAHGYIDSTHIIQRVREMGIEYDSNLCLYLQAQLKPLRHWTGMVRYPVFWEDDVHWTYGQSWDVDHSLATFLSPGLKVLSVHPSNFVLNTPNDAFYQATKSRAKHLSVADIARERFAGKGTRTFLLDLFARLRDSGIRFHTLRQAHALCSPALLSECSHSDAGRTERLSEAAHAEYWSADPATRQTILRNLYNGRNATDPYATSRDYNLRELEIEALQRNAVGSKILDLGCGNGYTLISLAKRTPAEMTGVDFSERLIEGAKTLAQAVMPQPTFLCADAIEYVRAAPSASVDCIIAERFLLNMPDEATQRAIIREAHRMLRGGGRLLMLEGSRDGFVALNKLRAKNGLPEIHESSGDNLSSLRFDDAEIEQFIASIGFRLIKKLGFSDYFIITRVLHPRLVAPAQPAFKAKINEFAREIQLNLPFRPGVGMNVLWVLERGPNA